jgi:hypothetical protein
MAGLSGCSAEARSRQPVRKVPAARVGDIGCRDCSHPGAVPTDLTLALVFSLMAVPINLSLFILHSVKCCLVSAQL